MAISNATVSAVEVLTLLRKRANENEVIIHSHKSRIPQRNKV